MTNQHSTEDEVARIAALMRDESDVPSDIMVQCPTCRRWRTIFASVIEAKHAGRCDDCITADLLHTLEVIADGEDDPAWMRVKARAAIRRRRVDRGSAICGDTLGLLRKAAAADRRADALFAALVEAEAYIFDTIVDERDRPMLERVHAAIEAAKP